MPYGSSNPESLTNPTTLSQQSTSLFSGVSQTIDRVGAGAQGAITNIAKALNIGGMAAAGSLRTSITQISGITPASKFIDNMSNKSTLPDFTPEQSRINGASNLPILQYPRDMPENKFIKFTFAAYYQPGPLFQREIIPTRSIILPLPSDLAERYGVQYAEKQLGVLGALQETGMLQGIATSNMSEGSVRRMGEEAGKLAKDPGNTAAVLRNVVGAISESTGAAIDRATGTILNPYSALQFSGVELRSHSFKYKFSPNSETESKIIKEIIREFKLRMLPEKRGLTFNFPDVCTIEFANKNSLYYFKNCYLKSMNVNYSPSGTPVFFLGGQHAAEIEISLDFGEIEPLSRNDILSGDFTGKVGQAMSSGTMRQQTQTPEDTF